MYRLTARQLIAVWIFGAGLGLIAFFNIDAKPFAPPFIVTMLGVLVFYTKGWSDFREKTRSGDEKISKMPSVLIGATYRHYKGGLYRVLNVAKQSETGEEMVVYQSVEKPEDVWVRPRKMFEERIEVNGKTQPRFNYID